MCSTTGEESRPHLERINNAVFGCPAGNTLSRCPYPPRACILIDQRALIVPNHFFYVNPFQTFRPSTASLEPRRLCIHVARCPGMHQHPPHGAGQSTTCRTGRGSMPASVTGRFEPMSFPPWNGGFDQTEGAIPNGGWPRSAGQEGFCRGMHHHHHHHQQQARSQVAVGSRRLSMEVTVFRTHRRCCLTRRMGGRLPWKSCLFHHTLRILVFFFFQFPATVKDDGSSSRGRKFSAPDKVAFYYGVSLPRC